MEFTFNVKGNYKAEFKKYVDELFTQVLTYTDEQRVALSDKLITAYVATTTVIPDGGQLSRLGSFILYEELEGNTKSNKSKTTEYNVLSDRQTETRERGEADARLATNYGTDGIKHGSGKRNTRTKELE